MLPGDVASLCGDKRCDVNKVLNKNEKIRSLIGVGDIFKFWKDVSDREKRVNTGVEFPQCVLVEICLVDRHTYILHELRTSSYSFLIS